jgi:tetratricopeptide (TPR) repeat protein
MPAATTPAREDRPALAANAYRRGERALDDNALERAITELRRAVELAPNEFHYQATLAWAQFCAADDKPAVADATRAVLSRAILRSDNPEQAQFFLGRVERMLGREKEALRHFNAVLASQPDHREAASEVRVLEARLGTRR